MLRRDRSRDADWTRARCGSRSQSTTSRAAGPTTPPAACSSRRSSRLGVRTHIDDFGTGASPLRLLHRFPGDAIKISRALVTGIGHDAGAFEIVRAVVGLAHNLGLEVIAEGVETARAARLPEGARLRVRAGLPHLRRR